MKQVAQDNDIQSYLLSAIGFEGRLLFLKGEFRLAERQLREAVSKLGDVRYGNVAVPFLGAWRKFSRLTTVQKKRFWCRRNRSIE